jgi:hypothetical protein
MSNETTYEFTAYGHDVKITLEQGRVFVDLDGWFKAYDSIPEAVSRAVYWCKDHPKPLCPDTGLPIGGHCPGVPTEHTFHTEHKDEGRYDLEWLPDLRQVPEIGLLRLRLEKLEGVILLEHAVSKTDDHLGPIVSLAAGSNIDTLRKYPAALRGMADWIERRAKEEEIPF